MFVVSDVDNGTVHWENGDLLPISFEVIGISHLRYERGFLRAAEARIQALTGNQIHQHGCNLLIGSHRCSVAFTQMGEIGDQGSHPNGGFALSPIRR